MSVHLKIEHEILKTYSFVAGVDEVGRGAFAGPVVVGICVVGRETKKPPRGLNDSKLLKPSVREALQTPIEEWAMGTATGESSAEEIDEWGLSRALFMAYVRGIEKIDIEIEAVILDGKHDWISAFSKDLFSPLSHTPAVTTRVKADTEAASVAAASVIAKNYRDAYMMSIEKEFPGYGFAMNVGYGTPQHKQAIASLGLTSQHRKSWHLSTE
ncbi:MAG: ribonuclease HII [Candidatus Nanopelagicales bacterium]